MGVHLIHRRASQVWAYTLYKWACTLYLALRKAPASQCARASQKSTIRIATIASIHVDCTAQSRATLIYCIAHQLLVNLVAGAMFAPPGQGALARVSEWATAHFGPQPPLGHPPLQRTLKRPTLQGRTRNLTINRPVTPLKSLSTGFQLPFPRVILRFGHLGGFFGNYANSEVSSAFISNIDLITDPKLAPAFSCGLFSPTSSRVVVMHLKAL